MSAKAMSHKKIFEIVLDKQWCNENKQTHPDVIGELIDTYCRVFSGMQVCDKGDCRCSIDVGSIANASASGDAYVIKVIMGATKDALGVENVSDIMSVTVRKLRQNAAAKVQKQISDLVGADEFKKLAREIASIAPQIKKYSTQSVFATQSYLFSIGDGCGFTTYVKLFADLLSELEIFEPCGDDCIVEITLKQQKPTDMPDTFMGGLAELKRSGSSIKKSGRIFCVDLSEWLGKTDDKDFRAMLSLVNDYSQDNIFIFRIPFVENSVLQTIKNSLADVLFIREVTFMPFCSAHLRECASRTLKKHSYSLCDDAWDVFDTRITEEKSDGRFYGINTVDKIVSEMIYRKQLSNIASGTDDTLIKKDDIIAIAQTYARKEKTASQMLSELVGMEGIAQRIEEIVTQIKIAVKSREGSDDSIAPPCLHMQFIGNSGTGKTTVARIVGKMLKENGVLRNGSFFEYSGRDFCGRFIGETAPKTASMCRDAYGSVLFIDEAYSLYRGGEDSRDFGREALDTLIAEMENHRSDMVVIMAGYSDEMETLMQGNPGLKSRMPYVVSFPNYTSRQLFDIFKSMLERDFRYDDSLLTAVREYFDAIPESVISSKEFSNARFVRNLYERTWAKSAMRSSFSGVENAEIVITREDFLQAVAEKEFSSAVSDKAKQVGFRS